MKVYREISLTEFEFWGRAKDRVKYLTQDELDHIEVFLEDFYPEGLSETDLNDLFWCDDDLVAQWLGYEHFGEIMERTDETNAKILKELEE